MRTPNGIYSEENKSRKYRDRIEVMPSPMLEITPRSRMLMKNVLESPYTKGGDLFPSPFMTNGLMGISPLLTNGGTNEQRHNMILRSKSPFTPCNNNSNRQAPKPRVSNFDWNCCSTPKGKSPPSTKCSNQSEGHGKLLENVRWRASQLIKNNLLPERGIEEEDVHPSIEMRDEYIQTKGRQEERMKRERINFTIKEFANGRSANKLRTIEKDEALELFNNEKHMSEKQEREGKLVEILHQESLKLPIFIPPHEHCRLPKVLTKGVINPIPLHPLISRTYCLIPPNLSLPIEIYPHNNVLNVNTHLRDIKPFSTPITTFPKEGGLIFGKEVDIKGRGKRPFDDLNEAIKGSLELERKAIFQITKGRKVGGSKGKGMSMCKSKSKCKRKCKCKKSTITLPENGSCSCKLSEKGRRNREVEKSGEEDSILDVDLQISQKRKSPEEGEPLSPREVLNHLMDHSPLIYSHSRPRRTTNNPYSSTSVNYHIFKPRKQFPKKLKIILDPHDDDNNNNNQDLPQSIICVICAKFFTCSQALGGHMSRAHPHKSKDYKKKLTIRDGRAFKRAKLKIAKKFLFEHLQMDYNQLMQTQEGQKIIKVTIQKNRGKLKKYIGEVKDEDLFEYIDDPFDD